MDANSPHASDELTGQPQPPGRKPKATLETVGAAVMALKAQGKSASVKNVRSMTAGSNGTVLRLRNQVVRDESAFESTLPLPDALVKALKVYADAAVAEVSQRWRQRYDESQGFCFELEAQAVEYEAEIEDLRVLLEQVGSERDAAVGRSTRLQEELNDRQQEIATLRNQLTAAELRARRAEDEREAAITRLLSEESASSKTKDDLDQHREVVANMREELSVTKTHYQYALMQLEQLRAAGGGRPIAKPGAHDLQSQINASQKIVSTNIAPAASDYGFGEQDSPL